MTEETWSGLAEAVSAIRAELEQAMEEGEGEKLRFQAGPVEMEFVVEVRKEGSAGVKVLVLPWTIGAKGTAASGNTHRLKVTLQPVDDQGDDAKISARTSGRPR